MSDFIYSTTNKAKGELAYHIESIYKRDKPLVTEFHGAWGSLAVSHNLYNGFQPLETDNHIVVIIGGPVLSFQDNSYLAGGDKQSGSRAIYHRWLQAGIQWDDDLSGPFVVLIIDKQNTDVYCITDLMMFIPVYQFQQESVLILGTHVDILADVSCQTDEIDTISVADFILHNVVTYPHTIYSNICQCHPAAEHNFSCDLHNGVINSKIDIYWLPEEKYKYNNINKAVSALRQGLVDYVMSVTKGLTHVAQFISAGEDSRVLSGILPKDLQRDAYIFVDNKNQESRIAKKVSNAYNSNFYPEYRSKTHYLEILSEAVDLIGGGHQYTHAHTLGFHNCCGLNKYNAVFGGYLSDSILKATHSRAIGGHPRFPFIPQFFLSGDTRNKKINNPLFKSEIQNAITRRRQKQFRIVQQLRPKTAHEWFVLWPSTMKASLSTLYCNRRLFCSYEPFMANQVVKIGAAVPVTWKLNRRLFQKAFRSYLAPSKWILHPEDHFPYFPWWINSIVQFVIRLGRFVGKRMGLIKIKSDQGPWGDWSFMLNSKNWKDAINHNREGFKAIKDIFVENNLNKIFESNQFNHVQKVNFVQVLYLFAKNQKNPN